MRARARRDMPVYKVIEIARRSLTLEILVPGTPKCSPRILELENCRQVCVPSIDVQQGFDSSISLVLGEGESIWNSHMSYLSYMPYVSHMSYMSDMFSTSIGARDLFACSLLMNQISLCQPSGNFSLPLWSALALGKMKKCYCLEGDLANNPLMDLLASVLSCELLASWHFGSCFETRNTRVEIQELL